MMDKNNEQLAKIVNRQKVNPLDVSRSEELLTLIAHNGFLQGVLLAYTVDLLGLIKDSLDMMDI